MDWSLLVAGSIGLCHQITSLDQEVSALAQMRASLGLAPWATTEGAMANRILEIRMTGLTSDIYRIGYATIFANAWLRDQNLEGNVERQRGFIA